MMQVRPHSMYENSFEPEEESEVCFQVVQDYERLAVFRLGIVRKGGAQGPGLCLTLPHTQEILTSDSVAVSVSAVVFYRVSDPMQAVCGDGDYNMSTKFKTQTVIRNVLGTRTLHEILRGREEMATQLRESLQAKVSQNGVTVDRLELKQVGIPRGMQKIMASEAEAKAEAKAKVILSNAEGLASQRLVSDGDNLSLVHPL